MRESFLFLVSTPFYLVVIVAEIVITSWHERRVYSFRGTLENVYLSVCNMGVDLLSRGIALGVLSFFFSHRFFNADWGSLYWPLLFVGVDFVFYWLHRIDHRCRFFWAIHVTHHSSEEFNFTVGFRSSVFQPVYRFLYFIPLSLAGFQSEDIYLAYSASQIYGIILHTRWTGKLGFLERVLVTPSHHRVHHGSNPEYIDKNMGMVLILWDRMFGTFVPESSPVKYGITKPLNSRNPLNLVFHEWRTMIQDFRKASGLKNKFWHIIGPPGWDGNEPLKK